MLAAVVFNVTAMRPRVRCPAIFKDNYRKSAHFESASVVGLDVDDYADVALAKDWLDEYGYQYIISASKSHQKEKVTGKGNTKPRRDRFRIILPLSSSITNEPQYKVTLQQMFLQFPFIDLAAMDSARFFFLFLSLDRFIPKGRILSTGVRMIHYLFCYFVCFLFGWL